MAKQFTYTKSEKFKSKKQLDEIFLTGKNFLVFPFKVVYSFNKTNVANELKMGVGVGKRNFGKAVDRNRIKRLTRESFRLHKHLLLQNLNNRQLHFFVLYIDKEMPESQNFVHNKMIKIFDKLAKVITNEEA